MKGILRYVVGIAMFSVLAFMEVVTWPAWVFFHWLYNENRPGPGLKQTLHESYDALVRPMPR